MLSFEALGVKYHALLTTAIAASGMTLPGRLISKPAARKHGSRSSNILKARTVYKGHDDELLFRCTVTLTPQARLPLSLSLFITSMISCGDRSAGDGPRLARMPATAGKTSLQHFICVSMLQAVVHVRGLHATSLTHLPASKCSLNAVSRLHWSLYV